MNAIDWEHRILGHRTAISDTLAFTYSEASNSCFSPDRGVFYTAYTASRRNYGESHDILAFTITPVCQPHKAITKVVLERGVTPSVIDAKMLICANCYYYTTDEILYNAKTHFGKTADIPRGFVRITIGVDGYRHYYIDYDIANDTFGELKELKVLYHGEVCHFTGNLYREYLAEFGFTEFNKVDNSEALILTDKFRLHEDGYRYTFATAAWAWPTAMRIKYGSDIMEFISPIPQVAQYETQSAIVNGKMYAILRGAKTDDFYISEDLGKTFRPIGRIDFNTTRPQLLPYNGKLLIAVSKSGITPNYVRDGRNNLLLLMGEGEDLSNYKEIFHIVDPFGIVYYDIVDYKGMLHMFWSSSDLYHDKNPQAKDLLWFTRIGILQ